MLWSKLSLPALLVVTAAHSASAARFVPEPQLPIEWNTEVGFAVQTVETVKFTVLVNEQNAERVRAIAEDVSNPGKSFCSIASPSCLLLHN